MLMKTRNLNLLFRKSLTSRYTFLWEIFKVTQDRPEEECGIHGRMSAAC
jgi:hypothetical protein